MITRPTTLPRKEISLGLSQVKQFIHTFAQQLRGGEVIALIGPLGAGKTTLTQLLGKQLGVHQSITSPTFILMQEYPTTRKVADGSLINLIHLDLYRTNSWEEITALGLLQLWQAPQFITVIEWADKIRSHLPPNTIFINLTRDVE